MFLSRESVGLEFWVDWDPTKIEYLRHTTNDHEWPYQHWIDRGTGSLWFSHDADTSHAASGDDVWATITFKYVSDGSSLTTMPSRFETVWLWDGENEPVEVNPASFVFLCRQAGSES